MSNKMNKTTKTEPTILKAFFQIEVRYKVPKELAKLSPDKLEEMMTNDEITFDMGELVYKGKAYPSHYDDADTTIRDNRPVEMWIDEYLDYLDDDGEEEEQEEDDEDKPDCVFCDKPIEDKYGGNNAMPLAKGSCCDDCNLNKVLPARVLLYQAETKVRWQQQEC